MKNQVCPWWLVYSFDNPFRRLFHDPEKICTPYLKEGMTAVDLGCGMGYFSVGMAKIVGIHGKIIAVDIQQKMLEGLLKRAQKAGVISVISPLLCDATQIGVKEKVDFALAFWMVHETPDQSVFFRQVHTILKGAGKLLVAEPKIHVSRAEFRDTVAIAEEVGFRLVEEPKISFSYAVVFEKTDLRG